MNTARAVLIVFNVLVIAAMAKAETKVEKNVVVGMYSGLALVMDVHYPENPNGYGIVHISGSGWRRPLGWNAPLLSESQVKLYGQPLVERGYTVFSLNHRATPRFQFPAPLEDVQRAVRFIRFHATKFGIDPDRIGAVGGSSGGHLVSLLGVMEGQGDAEDSDPVNRVSAKVQTVVARAAPTDFTSKKPGPTRVTLLGAFASEDPGSLESRRYRDASTVNYVSKDDPPFLLLYGEADPIVPLEQAKLFREKLNEAGVKNRLIVIPGAGHGPTFPGAVNPPDYIGAMITWFDEHLRKK